MIYITLDTNIWIYLANGYNVETEAYDEGGYVRAFEILKECTQTGDVRFLTCDLILEEWKRNKTSALERVITRIKNKQKATHDLKKNLASMLPELNADLDNIFSQYDRKVEKLIDDYRQRFDTIEDFLINRTEKFGIANEIRLVAVEQALSKKAPFCGDKSNSMADMLILLGSIDHISKKSIKLDDLDLPGIYPENYFVTSNYTDFSTSKNEKEKIHPDLGVFVKNTQTHYRYNFLNFINELKQHPIFTEKDQIIYDASVGAYEEYDDDLILCPLCEEEHYGMIYLSECRVRDLRYPIYDKQQQSLFPMHPIDKLNEKTYVEMRSGICSCCATNFIICPDCGTLTQINIGDKNICRMCGLTIRSILRYDRKGEVEDIDYFIEPY